MDADEQAITLGHPSYVWRDGQERRVQLIRRHVHLEGARILDAGCGLGLYVHRFAEYSARVFGIDIDLAKIASARERCCRVTVASAERLPFCDGAFDVVLSHEVLEHVADDRLAVAEAHRVLGPGGHLIVFVPNRHYPFETHGCYWRGRYVFGNIPLVNYLPDRWRNRLCPHVRAYTRGGLRALFDGLAGSIVAQQTMFAGYDNVIARHPALGRALRRASYALESTPLQALGLSHLVVFRKSSG